tara:strand:+ start:60 stop:710 length:651 start_codon:yes stop_codon:yes gene_type:complete
MSKEENNKTTIWTILDKVKYFVLLILFVVIIIILSKGYSIETSYFKIGKVPDTLFIEKEVKLPADTIYKEKVVTKYVDIPEKKKTTQVKNSETEVKVNNQPANINTGINNGILGNNNTFNSINEKPIILNDVDKKNILLLVNEAFSKIPKESKKEIKIMAMLGNSRSIQLADLIEEFLKKEGFNVSDSSQGIWSKTLKGVEIFPQNNIVRINIGII